MLPLTLLLAISTVAIPADEPVQETLFSGKVHYGGYFAPVVRFTDVKGSFATLVGIRGAWTVHRTLSLGFGGYGMATQNVEMDPAEIGGDFNETYYLQMGYGGMEVGFIQSSNQLVHFTSHILVGGGGVCYTEDWERECGDDDHVLDSDAFFVLEPSVDVELNVAKPFRIGLGASYRFVSDVELPALENEDIDGLSANLTFKFGWF